MPRRRRPDHHELVAAAVELRREGATAREISEALEVPVRGLVIREATALVPASERTGRMRAKDDLRMAAIQLRLQAKTYDEIQAELGVSKGSLSLWLSGLTLPKEVRDALLEQRTARTTGGASGRHRRALVEDEQARIDSERWLGVLSERELVISAAIAYWCEGSKSKPWKSRRDVRFMNSDPALVRLFLAGVEALGVSPDRLGFCLQIHESGDVAAAHAVWAEVVGVPVSAFARPTLKRHNPVTTRRNVDNEYIGCLVVRVSRSCDVYRQLAGIFHAAAMAAVQPGDVLKADTMPFAEQWGVV